MKYNQMIYKTFIRFVFLREMTFIRLVNYGEPSYIWLFQKKKKKLQILQKDVLCTTTLISFTTQDLQTDISIFIH